MAFLVSLSPCIAHREYPLGAAEVTVGRDAAACDIVVTGPTLSRRHLRIVPRGEAGYVLQDLRSTNGVFLNHQRVDGERLLREGDLIGLGSARAEDLRFQTETGRGRPLVTELAPKPCWTIGRSPENDIALTASATVSARHAAVRRRGDALELADQRSLNGTWVNGRRVRKARLERTDSVTIGSTLLRLQLTPAGALQVSRRDCRDEIALEAVGLTRRAAGGRSILDQVSLAIRPGEFVGLLGPSGAGKSTLLKALNGCQAPHYGCVLLNDTPLYRSLAMFRNAIGYVPQDDIVHGELSVRDSLDYVARLRLPHDVGAAQRAGLIDSTLETLGLSHVRGQRIFELSGGQRKRVSIGCELITHPSLLFLDEPTSGMDPSTEERLMRHFQAMARRGTTILITTHILYSLDLLDRIAILARGRLVFFGKPAEAMGFFTLAGRPLERPTQIFDALEADPAFAAAETGGDPREAIAEHYRRRYRESGFYREHVEGKLSEISHELLAMAAREPEGGRTGRQPPSAAAAPQAPGGAPPLAELLRRPAGGARWSFSLDFFSPRAFRTLTRRQFAIKLVSLKRALFYLTVPLALALVTLSLKTPRMPDDQHMRESKTRLRAQLAAGPIDLGAPIKAILSPQAQADPRPPEDVVYSLKHEGAANLPVPLSVLLMFVMTAVFSGTLMACLDLSTERPIYLRERMAGLKIADAIASKLPFLLLATAVQMALFLGLCALKPGLRQADFAGLYLALVAMAWSACAMGLFLSAIDPTAGQFSVILAIVAVLPQLILSGGLGPDFFKGMPAAMRWVAGLFPARWGTEMLLTACYRQPGHAALGWVGEFIPGTIGFQFGLPVYFKNSLILLAQGGGWLLACALALKRLDRTAGGG